MPRNMGLSSPIILSCYGYLHITLMSQVNLQYTAGLTLPSENYSFTCERLYGVLFLNRVQTWGPFAASQFSAALCLSQNWPFSFEGRKAKVRQSCGISTWQWLQSVFKSWDFHCAQHLSVTKWALFLFRCRCAGPCHWLHWRRAERPTESFCTVPRSLHIIRAETILQGKFLLCCLPKGV